MELNTLCVLSVELASCHPSGPPDFEVASRFFGKFVDPYFRIVLKYVNLDLVVFVQGCVERDPQIEKSRF
jgi:hypothetical protein